MLLVIYLLLHEPLGEILIATGLYKVDAILTAHNTFFKPAVWCAERCDILMTIWEWEDEFMLWILQRSRL